MQSIPQRQSLVSQTVEVLRQEIAQQPWGDWLPAERKLCAMFQVSRNTLRAALARLQREGLIRAEHGAGNRILTRPGRRKRKAPSRDVGLLSPEPLERLRPTQTLWIDELRALLNERGCRLHVFHGAQYFRNKPGATLAKLTAQHAHSCWILTLSDEAIQRWFSDSGVPCVVAGSVHAGLSLPSRDLDHRAMCRHAAGVLLGLGHRRLALVITQSPRAGDLESEAGFREGLERSSHAGASAVVGHHDGTVDGLRRALGRLMSGQSPPTGLLVANAYHYLAVVTRLGQLGLKIPQDVSVISRDEDPFLSFVIPTPARYAINARALSKSLLEPIVDLMDGRAPARPTVRLMPEFIRGESIAGAPGGGR